MMERRKDLKKKAERKREPITKTKVLTAIFVIGFAFLGSFLLHFILQIALNTQTPMVVVISGSMEPNINKGDLLFLRGMDPEHIKEKDSDNEGDVIVYDASGLWEGAPEDPIVHRVIDKYKHDGKWYFITKGDANAAADKEPVPAHRILGVVCGRIPYVGWIKIVMTDYGLFIPILIILSVPLIVSIIWDVIKTQEKEGQEEKHDKIQDLRIDTKIEEDDQEIEDSEVDDDFDF